MSVKYQIVFLLIIITLFYLSAYSFAIESRKNLSPEKALAGHWISTKLDPDIEEHDAVAELHYYFSDTLATRVIFFGGNATYERGAPDNVVVKEKYTIKLKGDNWLKIRINRIGTKKIVFSEDRNSFTMESVGVDFGVEFKYMNNEQEPGNNLRVK